MRMRAYAIEVVQALAVLAVVFLNFAAAPLASAASYGDDAASWCGAPAEGDGTGHFTCAACRLDTATDVPPVGQLATRLAIALDRSLPFVVAAPLARVAPLPPARGPPLV
jgi:hypothetical protein